MSEPALGIIDYGSGNLRSVSKALAKVGARVSTFAEAGGLDSVDAVVLPGVGAYGDCAEQLQKRGLWTPLRRWLDDGRPFLGICLGYQLLFESSEESPGVPGFGFFKGHVRRFADPALKVPQIGWNSLDFTQDRARLWQGLTGGTHVYFVHSYYPVPADRGIVAATAHYGEHFASAVESGPVMGVQFHPEKSQAAGLTMLRNFVDSFTVKPNKTAFPAN